MPDVTERARELRDAGLSFRLVAETLNAEGYRGKKGGLWHDGSVFRLLQPPKPPNPLRGHHQPHTEESKRKMSESHKRAYANGKQPSRHNAKKTHCPKGHPYDEENTYLIPGGGRACRECGRESVRRRRKQQREANPRIPRVLPRVTGELDYRVGSPGRRAYGTMHLRVRQARGPARRRRCTHCAERGTDKRAYDWARLRDCGGKDVMDYIPLCRRCHVYYDRGLIPPELRDRSLVPRPRLDATEAPGRLGDAGLGRKRAEQQRAKTHCPAGHEYTEANTYIIKRAGGRTARQCKTCTRAKAAESAARRKGA